MERNPVTVTLPELHPTLRDLVQLSTERKWMSYEELNTSLPDEMVDPEKLDELLVLCNRLGVEFIDEETVRRNRYETFQAPLQTNLKFKRDDPKKPGGKKPKISVEDDHGRRISSGPAPAAAPAEPDDEILDEAEAQAVIQQ